MALTKVSRKLPHRAPPQAKPLFLPVPPLYLVQVSSTQVLLGHLINWPMGPSFPQDSKLEGRIWLWISRTQQKAKINNGLNSYPLQSAHRFLDLHTFEWFL